jgi:4-amino-4-deoxy-L-arabinose transferase-like glycosyltransferase
MPAKNANVDKEALLVEYQAAQDSAQHHDSLVWTTTGIIWGAGLVLIGFVIENMNDPRLKVSIIATSVLAILLLVYLWVMALTLGSVRNQKYARCKEIEKVFQFEQHSKLRYPNRSGRIFYGVIMVVFIVSWILIIITAAFS